MAVDFPYGHVQQYVDQGYSVASIAQAIGRHKTGLNRARRVGRCSEETYRRLMNLDVEKCPYQPGWRVTRRVRALMAAGVTTREIAADSGLHHGLIAHLAGARRKFVTLDTFRAIDQVWDARKNDPVQPPVAIVRTKRWAVPWEWDNIDGDEDLHGDAFVPLGHLEKSLRRAAAEWGVAETARVLDLGKPGRVHDILAQTKIRQSIKSKYIDRLYRERRNREIAKGQAA